ncbi:MAG TPA: DUF2993 domain-containing protein [Negativicutes bacterium]|nr:DUF2993 domain-containing protein [Negativicutes bacterium]
MLKRLLLITLLSFLGVVVLSELLLPYMIGRQAETALGRAFGTGDIQAAVKARPALAMLGGNFSEITVNGKDLHTGKLTINRLSAVFTDTKIDLARLITAKSLTFREIGGFDGTLVLKEEDVNQYITNTVKGLKNVHVTIDPDNTKVAGDLTLGPVSVAVTMHGKLRGEQNLITFKAEQLLVNNAAVGLNLASGLTEFPVFDLKKLPVPATVREISSESGQVVIRIGK